MRDKGRYIERDRDRAFGCTEFGTARRYEDLVRRIRASRRYIGRYRRIRIFGIVFYLG